MNILFQDETIRIEYNPDNQILFVNWLGHQNMDTIRKACAIILSLIRERGFTKILNDNTHVEGPWHDASGWIQNEWFPSVIAAGLGHFAWVLSGNIFAMLSAKRALPEENAHVIRTFASYEEAIKWLCDLR